MTLNDIHGNQTTSFIWIKQFKVETVTAVSETAWIFSSLVFNGYVFMYKNY